MSIYSITYHHVKNYGAVLQAFALNNYLRSIFPESYVVDYETVEDRRCFTNLLSFHMHSWKNNVISVFNLFHYYRLKQANKKFIDFISENIQTTDLIESYEKLTELDNTNSLFIAGSDQIWNCSSGIKKHFFLEGICKAKKCAYAASMGIDKIPDNYLDEALNCLKTFSYISVRENSTKEYFKNKLKIECETVIDPVFLLSQTKWRSLEQQVKVPKKYILVYSLSTRKDLNLLLKDLSKKTNFPILEVCVNGFSIVKNSKKLYDIGPKEFLYLIDNATYIVASSFHAIAFSLIFKKDFYVYANDTTGLRIHDLLNKYDMTNRIINYLDISNFEIYPVDYSKYELEILKEINCSKQYINKCIS